VSRTIQWCGLPCPLERIVVTRELADTTRIPELAAKLGLPIVTGETALRIHDLWVGRGPTKGWGKLAGDTYWARSVEAPVVERLLEEALGASR